MAGDVPPSFEGDPYTWDTNQDPPPESVRTLWNDVANGLEKSQQGKFVMTSFLVESQSFLERLLSPQRFLPIVVFLVDGRHGFAPGISVRMDTHRH